MLGTIIGIEENEIILKLTIDINKTQNLVNLYVTMKDPEKTIVGEIANIKDGMAYINMLGEMQNDKFVFGVVRKPSFSAQVELIAPKDINKIIGIEDYKEDVHMYIGQSTVYPNINVGFKVNDFFANHFAIFGSTGSGKSTLINNLLGKANAITGNRPGVTRGKQWFRVGEYIEVLDTPGTLYPKLNDQVSARHLAYLGSIKDEVVDTFELSVQLLSELAMLKPDAISSRYGFIPSESGEKDLEEVARSRSFLLKGGAPDTERASVALIDDFRKGRLGRITLDKAELL